MKTYRVVEYTELKRDDFYDVPFWIHHNGHYAWVGYQHVVNKGELHSNIVVRWVIDGITQAPLVIAPEQNVMALMMGVNKMFDPYYNNHNEIRRSVRRGTCACERHLGEPCYCFI